MSDVNTAGMHQQSLPLTFAGNRLIPITHWPKYHPWPTVSALRHLRFNRHENGFSDAFVTVRGRVLIDEQRFFEICRAQGE